jgi:protein pelota
MVFHLKLIYFDKKKGKLKIQVENLDDLWILFNIISKGDHIYAKTVRRVKQAQETARSDKGERIPVFLGIEVEDLSFHGFADRLRIKGKIIQGPEDLISLGSYHTFNVDLGFQLEIVKENWIRIDLKRIDEAVKMASHPNVILCAIDSGEATIAVVGDYQTKIITRITENIPGARVSDKEHTNIYKKFFSDILTAIIGVSTSYSTDHIIIAGPGFVKDHFYEYFISKKPEFKNKIALDSVSSGDVNSIYEMIKRGATSSVISKLRVAEESQLMDEVLKRLGKGKSDVAYGMDNIKDAVRKGAVDTLLITDELLRQSDLQKRAELYSLLEDVEKMGGKTHIISITHQAGEILKGIKSIAAILRYEIN